MVQPHDVVAGAPPRALAKGIDGPTVQAHRTTGQSTLRSLKVTPPQLPPRVVQRPRLWAGLDRAIERPLTLICAGPGSGKTVLVNQWSRVRSHPVVWVSLDPRDDREDRFWSLVQDALHRQGFSAGPSGAGDGRPLMERAIEELAEAASRADGQLVLVLDDVHVLGDAEALASLDGVLRHPPQGLRVIMTSLSDPMLPLHRYRLEGSLSEIRAAELAMSVSEVEKLLWVHGIRLDEPQVEMLHERTEGWVAGLRLSAMRMEGSPDPQSFVTGFAMDRGSIGEYLMEEVLASQPPEVRSVLVRSSICDPISGPLADAICETEGSGAVLRQLAAKNIFVVAVDHQGVQYRYHPLLQEVLRHLLLREPTNVQRRGHQNAAHWFDAQGYLVEALGHALQAQDWTLCADLLTRGAFEELYLRAAAGSISSIERFVAANPSPGEGEEGWADVRAAQAAVAVAIEVGQPRALLEVLERTAPSRQAAPLLGFARLRLARQDSRLTGLREAAEALTLQDPMGPFGTVALSELGAADVWQGSTTRAESTLQQALKQATALSMHAIALACQGWLAVLHASTGRLSRAEELLAEGSALLNAHPWIPAEFRGPSHLGSAQVAMLQGDSDLYQRFLGLVDADLASKAHPALPGMAALVQAEALQSAGRVTDAVELLSNQLAREDDGAWDLRSRADIALLELEAQIGRPKKAIHRLVSHDSGTEEPLAAQALLALSRAHVMAGDLAEADRLVRRILTTPRAPDLLLLVQTLLLESEIAQLNGDETAAVEAATRAAQLAATQRIVLPFIVATPRIRPLLLGHPALRDAWPAPLDDDSELWSPQGAVPVRTAGLPEALTQREAVILKWLTTTMTMAEIANELYVSTNTVKTHVAAIYRKLNVSSRREAIARGRQLRLL